MKASCESCETLYYSRIQHDSERQHRTLQDQPGWYYQYPKKYRPVQQLKNQIVSVTDDVRIAGFPE